MRLTRLLPAVAISLVLAVPAYAQGWAEFVNRAEFFAVNMPGDPVESSITYKTAKGTMLPAKLFTAKDARGGDYRVTVVNFATAPDEAATAAAEAAKVTSAKGEVKYSGVEHSNNVRSWRVTVILPGGRQLLAEIATDRNRMYILEADTPANVPPPAQFQASLQFLDDAGVALRYRNPDSTERVR
jgi:hypothetical protein